MLVIFSLEVIFIKKIMLIFGTRPEAIKMCPLVLELKKRVELDVIVCVTGQHRELLSGVLDFFGISPDYDLAVMKAGQTLSHVTSEVLLALKDILCREQPDAVLVHGDTSTAFSATLAAFYQHIPVYHVEAGLRTHNILSPFPEEFNRRAVSLMASHHFAPTERARQNLLSEGVRDTDVTVTGNTVIDALSYTVREDFSHPELAFAESRRLILLTMHRRENIGNNMRSVFRAVRRICEEYDDVRVLFPCHPNPEVRRIANEELGSLARLRIIEPLDTLDFHNFLSRAYLVLTDSGGIQEEAPSFSVPVLVLRDTTERPEGLAAGTLMLVGTDEENVYEYTRLLLDNKEAYKKMTSTENPYGDGNACRRIADVIERI